MVNKVGKGKRLEKLFRDTLKKCYPSCLTELKPMLKFMQKDFWGLFDGITFFPNKKKYLFWQTKSNKLTPMERKKFWYQAEKFQANNIKILLIEKNKEGLLISANQKEISEMKLSYLKNFINKMLR
jgi:hypothetical protein